MESISPLITEAFRLFHTDLYEHLDEVEFFADSVEDWSLDDASTAGTLLTDLCHTVRSVLGKHTADINGGCRTCGRPWPCQVVTAVHLELKSPDHQFRALLDRATQARARLG